MCDLFVTKYFMFTVGVGMLPQSDAVISGYALVSLIELSPTFLNQRLNAQRRITKTNNKKIQQLSTRKVQGRFKR